MSTLPVIIIRGAGDLATGVATRLHRAGFYKILLLDIEKPLAVRRTVAFSEVMYTEKTTVEDITAVRINNTSKTITKEMLEDIWQEKMIPVLADASALCVADIKPEILVDAILAKRNIGTKKDMAELVIGLGPGFSAAADVHKVIETKRGHYLGRVIHNGEAIPNTGIPGEIGGFARERVYWATGDGIFTSTKKIGDIVAEKECLGYVDKEPVFSLMAGILRGLLPNDTQVKKGVKLADIDPRKEKELALSISEKALAIGGGVLEAVSHFYLNKNK